jgi:hypothetical protein
MTKGILSLACLPSILAGCSIIATEVGRVVASEASLSLQPFRDAIGGITDEHAEALYIVSVFEVPCACRCLTGLNAVTWPLPPET